jgi:surfactin family lipopeptide synthetase A
LEKLYRYIAENINSGKIDKQTAVQMLKILKQDERGTHDDIAIIGISARLPFAENLNDFWENIKNGLDCIGTFPESRRSDTDRYLAYSDYYAGIRERGIKYSEGAFLNEIDKFDYNFFRMSPKEAQLMDPFQRIFLETAYEAIENAGYGGKNLSGTCTGVYLGFASTCMDSYQKIIYEVEPTSIPDCIAATLPAIIPSRVSYLLNLNGPSMVIDTACSSSLVALHLACQAIKNGDCEQAIAGGIKLHLLPLADEYLKTGMESSDGRTRTFDSDSDGTGMGEGTVAIFLKPLGKAKKDGDTVYAVIKGSAINQDGNSMGITAPNPDAQTKVIVNAWKDAGIDPETISYIEVHGTGTKLGDPIEIKGLRGAFENYTQRRQFCALSSVKSNIGHLYECAGLVNLIKAVMAIKNKTIPPSIHFDKPNRGIDFGNSPVYPNTRMRKWEPDTLPRRCGVNSFGLSGTNCHVVLEEYNSEELSEGFNGTNNPDNELHVFTLSAKSLYSMKMLLEKYGRYLDSDINTQLEDICFTANTGRGHYSLRLAIIISDKFDLKNKLSVFRNVIAGSSEVADNDNSFIFFGEHKLLADNAKTLKRGELSEEMRRELTSSAKEKIFEYTASNNKNEELLSEICRLYVKGAEIDWKVLYEGASHRRICLPAYAFEPKRCWVNIPQSKNGNGQDDFYYSVAWKQEHLKSEDQSLEGQTVLVLKDNKGISDILINTLKNEGVHIIEVEVGNKFLRPGRDNYSIGPGKEDYRKLMDSLVLNNVNKIIHFASLSAPIKINGIEDINESQDYGVYSLYRLIKAIIEKNCSNKIEILLVSSYVNEVTGEEERICPENATLFGLGKVIGRELSGLSCRCVDIEGAADVEAVISEMKASGSSFVSSYRKGIRYIEEFRETDINQMPDKEIEIKNDGVYVITGGMGGIGLEIASFLASQNCVNIAIINRTEMSKRENWEDIFEKNENKELIRKIKAVRALEAAGTRVECCCADVSDADGVYAIFTELRQKYKRINGVIHCAGISGDQFVADREFDKFEEILRPKVHGTWILDHATGNDNLDFFIMSSSIATIFSAAGQGDYIAANSYMDSYTAYRNKKGNKTLTINWATWKETGMAHNFGVNMDTAFKAMTTSDAICGFQHVMNKHIQRVLIGKINYNEIGIKLLEDSTVNLSSGIRKHIDKYNKPVKETGRALSRQRTTVENVNLAGRDNGSYTEMEKAAGIIWGQVLGYEEINIFDNFYELGGDSIKGLKIINEINHITGKLAEAADLLRNQTVEQLAAVLQEKKHQINQSNNGQTDSFPIKPAPEKESYPLSSAQKRLYVLEQLKGAGAVYNLPWAATTDGILDKERIQAILNIVCNRHDSLRTYFELEEGEPVQKILKTVDFKVEYGESLQELDTDNKEMSDAMLAGIVKPFVKPFDLSKAPLLRVVIIRFANKKSLLMFDMHHIISDGVSMSLLIKDIAALYSGQALPEQKLQYKDYTSWQEDFTKSDLLKKQEAYWLNRFSGDLPVLNMPVDYPRPPFQCFEGGRLCFTAGKELKDALKEYAANSGATIFMVLLAAYNVALHKYTGQEDIIVGSPVTGRKRLELSNILGMFVNTIALRNFPVRDMTFSYFLESVKMNCLQAYENQDYLFEDLIDKLEVKRDLGRNPLFDTMFSMLVVNSKAVEIADLKLKHVEVDHSVSKFDLALSAAEEEDRIDFILEFSTRLFQFETMERFCRHFLTILQGIVHNPEVTISKIELITPEEKNEILYEFNNTKADYPNAATIHELFENQVKRTPANVAVIYGKTNITYHELNWKANKLARLLREKGVKPDTIVGMITERSIEMVVGIMAILKAGGAYLPIDPGYPAERISYVLEDSKAKLLVMQNRFLKIVEYKIPVIDLEDEENYPGDGSELGMVNTSRDLAYVIYTSGSTGNPKGAMIEHRSLVNRLNWMNKKYPISENDTILQKTPYTFDVSVWELLWWSFTGAGVCMLAPGGEKDPVAILKAIEENRVTTMHFVPSMLNAFLEYLENGTDIHGLSSLRQVFASGETLNPQQVKRFNHLLYKNTGTKLHNLYGPTEAAIDVSYFDCSTGEELEIIPIGKPIDNIQLYILDKQNNLQPVGVPGELHIAGAGLARGYLNKESLTMEKFVPCPYGSGETDTNHRMYKTGDLARWLPNGDIEYLGRTDSQVKIRGFRIELGEIESRVMEYSSVKEASVLAIHDENDEKCICAYAVSDIELDMKDLRAFLQKNLPYYMIPSYFVQVDKMPLSANGKLDRKALPAPDKTPGLSDGEGIPGTVIEMRLLLMFEKILGVGNIGANDSFFELGGHSVKAVSLISMIFRELGTEVPLSEVFLKPTVRELAEFIKLSGRSEYQEIEDAEEKETYGLSSAQRKLYILSQHEGIGTSYNMSAIRIIEGELDTVRMENCIGELIQRHEALRTSFHMKDGEPVQYIHKTVDFTVYKFELSEKYSNAENGCFDTELNNIMNGFVKPFDLSLAPLLRIGLVKLGSQRHALLYDAHHIISDGISTEIFIREFAELYKGQQLSCQKIQYKDFSEWQNRFLQSERAKSRKDYWKNTFMDRLPVLDMPLDYKRSEKKTFAGGTVKLVLPVKKTNKYVAFALKNRCTLNAFLFSSYALLVSKYSNQEDLVIGSLAGGRQQEELRNVIGVFINFLPVRINAAGSYTFSQYLKAVNMLLLSGYENQDYPFENMIEDLNCNAGTSRNPIFDTMMVFQNQFDMGLKMEFEGLKLYEYKFEKEISTLDFKMDILTESNGDTLCLLQYNPDLFRLETMESFVNHFALLLETVAESPSQKISEIELFTEEERKLLEQKRSLNAGGKEGVVKLATSATFVADPVENYIKWWCRQFGINIEVSFAPYNQVFQQLLDRESILSENTGINLILVRFEDWIRDSSSKDEIMRQNLKESYKKFIEAFKNRKQESTYYVGVFPVSTHLGLSREISNTIEDLYERWGEEAKQFQNVEVIDFRTLSRLYEIDDLFDPVKDKAGHLPFSDEFYAAMGTIIARNICSHHKQQFKVIALDCDNTLWEGVCGEDGPLGVQVREAHKTLQGFLLKKSMEGMPLVLCSKNNEADVLEVFEKNTEMLIKKDHLAAWKINWETKSDNLKALAKELNLGLDSFVFMDDSPVECFEVMTNCPEVLTVELPGDLEEIPAFLEHIWAFDSRQVTEEDRNRTRMYIAERKRHEVKDEKTSLQEFIKELGLKISMNKMAVAQASRAAQLTHRTNQFNLSAIRRNEQEILELSAGKDTMCLTVNVSDKFGDYGLVGLLIVIGKESELLIDTFLLSCRALGRNVEDVILAGLGRYCKENGFNRIEANYHPTPKNTPFADFLERTGWDRVGEVPNGICYVVPTDKIPEQKNYADFYYMSSYEAPQPMCIPKPSAIMADVYADKQNRNPVIRNKNWNISIVNDENLLHKSYLLPIKYHTGRSLSVLPVEEIPEKAVEYADYEEPRNFIERKLSEIYGEILGTAKVGRNDDFFKMGGHSLKAATLVSKVSRHLNADISISAVFQKPSIKDLALHIASLDKNTYSTIEPAENKEYYPLSSSQKRLYLLNQLDSRQTNYNMPMAVFIEGAVEKERLRQALEILVKRHESLRTSFELVDDEPMQRIHKDADIKICFLDAGEEDVDKVINNFIKPFDLAKTPLMNIGLAELSAVRRLLVIDMHHIISDGSSMGILLKELSEIYGGKNLQPLRIQYKDFSQWQDKLRKQNGLKLQEEYWLGRFSGEIPVLELPLDYQRPVIQSFEGDSIRFEAGEELTGKLAEISWLTGTTLFMVLLGAYNMLLSKYTGQEDIVVGTPVAGRNHDNLEKMIGVFINTLALRNRPEPEKTFAEFMDEVKENSLKAYENQEYQFDELVQKLNVKRDLSRSPVFDTMFILQNTTMPAIEIDSLRFIPMEYNSRSSKYDITLTAKESGGAIKFELEYCTRLFKRETVERMAEHFINILENVVKDPGAKLCDIGMLSGEEKTRLLTDFSYRVDECIPDKTISELFYEQAGKTPDHIAVVFESDSMSYNQLNKISNQLAGLLKKEGARASKPIGLMLRRGINIPVGMLGILKAGGAYLPVDPDYPASRITYILGKSEVEILVTESCLMDKVKEIVQNGNSFTTLVLLSEDKAFETDAAKRNYSLHDIRKEAADDLHPNSAPEDLMYLIYTSGSTGLPKGVMVTQRNAVNYLKWSMTDSRISEKDGMMLVTSISFDISVFEIFAPLLSGACLHIISTDMLKDMDRLIEYINREKISIWHSVPALMSQMLAVSGNMPDRCRQNCMGDIRRIMIGGEAWSVELAKEIRSNFAGADLVNMYGPTEATIWVTSYKIGGELEQLASLPIGKPIANNRVLILDAGRRLCGTGIPGEIYISGANVTKGYYKDEEKTKEVFVTFEKNGEVIYKTGDMGRLLPDGNIEYLGRKDGMVKVRGYRIETGEIESVLLAGGLVEKTAVIVKSINDTNVLVCYYVSQKEQPYEELKSHLRNKLPEYMIPSHFISLGNMLYTPNGKIDRKALTALEITADAKHGNDYAAARTQTQRKLIGIWEEILGISKIGIYDNLFEIGGNSIFVMKIINNVNRQFAVKAEMTQLFKFPTIHGFAEYLDTILTGIKEILYSGIPAAAIKPYYPLSSAQKRFFVVHQFSDVKTNANITGMTIIEGRLDVKRLEGAFHALIKRHETLRTSFGIVEGQPVQIINEHVDFTIQYAEYNENSFHHDLKTYQDKDVEKANMLAHEFVRDFDLGKAPLMRVKLVNFSEDRYLLLYDMHHIISDGLSMGILVKEFFKLYNTEQLSPLRIQYKDFAAWQNNLLESDAIKGQGEYWLNRFSGELPVLEIPTDYPRPEIQSFEGDCIRFEIGKELASELRKLASASNASLYMVLLAVYNVLLLKYSGQEDIVVGSTVALRPDSDLEHIIGVLINMLPMRNYPVVKKSFHEFLGEVRTNALEAYENRDYQFEMLVDRLLSVRDISRNPLFTTAFTLQDMDVSEKEIGGLKFIPVDYNTKVAVNDLNMMAYEHNDKILFMLEYSIRLFKKATVKRLAEHYINIASQVVENPDALLGDIEVLSKTEEKLLKEKYKNAAYADEEHVLSEEKNIALEAEFNF